MKKLSLLSLLLATGFLTACLPSTPPVPLEDDQSAPAMMEEEGAMMEEEGAMMEEEGAMMEEEGAMMEGDAAMEAEVTVEGDASMEAEGTMMEEEGAMMEKTEEAAQ